MITRPNVKINLGLHVLRRREDGYHDIETLFVPYHGLSDILEIIPADDYSRTSAHLQEAYDASTAALRQAISPDGRLMITIAREQGVHWDPSQDLTVRAYRVLAADFKLPPVKIYLEKLSPVGAGLGGGSADAAFALRMLSDLFGLGLGDDALAGYAALLGSDCAFFVYNTPMIGSGRGEILTPFDLEGILGDEYEIRVVVPEGIAVSTADAYRGIVPREDHPVSLASLTELLRTPVGQWREVLVNDFEATVFAKYPALSVLKEELYKEGAAYASMSGSGSALFGIFRR